jgi:3-oxoacyl-[acyl-carrier protein] reductase
MDLRLAGKRAAVAAASTGLGYSTASALAREGADVVICSHDLGKAAAAAEAMPGHVSALARDLSGWDAGVEFVRAARSRLGGLDILVVNHPGPPIVDATALDEATVRAALERTLLVSLGMCQEALAAMRTQGWGRIIAITSISVREPMPGLVLSNIARPALTGYLRSITDDAAGDGVTVNTVQPGYHATARLGVENATRLAADIPARRVGAPDDFGNVVAFLCSDAAGYITGASVPVDGGYHRGLQ